MSKPQDSLPPGEDGPDPNGTPTEKADGLAAGTNFAPGSAFRMNENGDLGGHTSLSRPTAPQGRRSLFGR